MKVTKVKSASNSYHVYVGENIRCDLNSYLPKDYSSIFIVTDEIVAKHYLEEIKKSISHKHVYSSVIPYGEKSKNVNTFYQLHTDAIEFGLDRHSLIIALGGGVVGDVAGFVAATYMRGVDFIQMPTTILAHDSSVGGKVAINHEQGKNLIGNFYPPAAVVYDVQTLQTLNDKEIRSGYAELIKEALIQDDAFFQSLLASDLSSLTNDVLANQLNRGIEIKASIVEEDERESGVRKYLNLGHTLGHALESIIGYGVRTHGEMVAIGLLFAIRVSEKVFSIKLPYDQLLQWLNVNAFPIQLTNINKQQVLNRMKLDKKTVNTTIQMVLLKDIAQPVVVEISDEDLLNYLDSFLKEIENNVNLRMGE
ncbi:3-dehydroquinate synthase [Virgibacillus subterraneus]|uniref:3-dehydroquinate synthase n=1 Tax=Virgibacillus subterraneus TaxID=621109 RepID=A0A1H9EJI6_9BACI|nr:3-dehydroquinate synthase [Virgibacillus subterraneus]SEQ25841.1 3-dehydroquinate synthase [Virgibacillus subterraneus]